MTYDIKIPFGRHVTDGRILYIDDAEQGLACDCVCPKCETPLIGVKGKIYAHHFRHQIDPTLCEHARETALHLFAKQIICEERELRLPNAPISNFPFDLGPIKSATAEFTLSGSRFDVLLEYAAETIAVEIWVAHEVPEEKAERLSQLEQAALQIDLRPYRDVETADWRQAILYNAYREWIVPPKIVRNERQRRYDVHIAKIRAEREAAEAAYAAAEQRRVEAEQKRKLGTVASIIGDIEQLRQVEWNRREEIRRKSELEAQVQAEQQDAETRAALSREARRIDRPPDLQQLVVAFGTYSCITAEAWKRYDAEMQQWQDRRRDRLRLEQGLHR